MSYFLIGSEESIHFLLEFESKIDLVVEGLISKIQGRLSDFILICQFRNSIALLIDALAQSCHLPLEMISLLLKNGFPGCKIFLHFSCLLLVAFLNDLKSSAKTSASL